MRPTTAHILNGCPTALQQGRYTYCHDQVLLSLLLDIQKCCSCSDYAVFADINDYQASDTPLATIPPSVLPTTYRPDIVLHNAQRCEIQLLELTCPFNSTEQLQAAHDRKVNKGEYQLLLSELDRLGYICQYLTIEIGCLGHQYLSDSIKALQSVTKQSV